MALLGDEGWIDSSALAEEDGSILELAQQEGIDLAAKLRLAIGDIRSDVKEFLRKNSIFGLENAAVDWNLQRWAVYQALSCAYRDAYFHQLSDRYAAKWKLYSQHAELARERCWNKGIGIISYPLPRPREGRVQLLAGDHAPRNYWFALTWQMPNGQASVPGLPVLVRPTGLHSLSFSPGQAGPNGAGWHLYAGPSPEEMVRQTSEPLPIESAWEMPSAGLADGEKAGPGQAAEFAVRGRRVLRRR